MSNYKIEKLVDHSEMLQEAANWFHEKWGIEIQLYEASMKECINRENKIPQWYIVVDKGTIIAGLGVIENDFHDRKDLTPNV